MGAAAPFPYIYNYSLLIFLTDMKRVAKRKAACPGKRIKIKKQLLPSLRRDMAGLFV
jgi:hypothetical protein